VVVTERLAALGHPVRRGPAEAGPWHQHRRNWAGQVFDRVAQWRGELDPANGELRAPWQPGTADRLWLCLQKMTDTATDAGRPGQPQGAAQGRRAGAGRRVPGADLDHRTGRSHAAPRRCPRRQRRGRARLPGRPGALPRSARRRRGVPRGQPGRAATRSRELHHRDLTSGNAGRRERGWLRTGGFAQLGGGPRGA